MAEALRCMQCGASLPPITPEVASVICHSCGDVNRIAGDLLEALHTHERRVGGYREQSRRAGEGAIVSQVTASFGGGWAGMFVVSWLIAAVAVMPEQALGYVIAALIFVAPFAALFVVGRRRYRRFAAEAEAAREGERAVVVHCPTCGGQSELSPEVPVLPCRYCAGALAADESALRELIAVARDSAERERRVAVHQGWRLAAHRNRDPRTGLVPFFVIGGIGSLWVIGTLAVNVRTLLGLGAVDGPGVGELAVMNAIALVIVVGVATPLVLRRRRMRRWIGALRDLAARSGGSLTRDPASFAEWLVAHWSGEFSGRRICAGLGYAFVSASGAPWGWWALSVAPDAQGEGPVERHLRILVPGRAGGSLLAGFRGRLEALGFHCEADEGGLVASLGIAELDALVADPQGLESIGAALAHANAS